MFLKQESYWKWMVILTAAALLVSIIRLISGL